MDRVHVSDRRSCTGNWNVKNSHKPCTPYPPSLRLSKPTVDAGLFFAAYIITPSLGSRILFFPLFRQPFPSCPYYVLGVRMSNLLGKSDNLQPWSIATSVSVTGLAFVAVCLRMLSRYERKQQLWWDDWMIIFSMVRVFFSTLSPGGNGNNRC